MKIKQFLIYTLSLLFTAHTFFISNTLTVCANINEVSIVVNGESLNLDVPAQIIDGRTMVPMRAIFEKLGAKVDWDAENKEVYAYKPGVLIQMQIGSTTVYRNTVEQAIDVPAQIINDRTLVPVRVVSEYMGAIVTWDDETQTVYITPTDNIQYINWSDDYYYYGEVVNGKATGYGVLYSKIDDSMRQIGKYIDYKIVVGTDYFDNGSIFAGNYEDGEMSYGTYYFTNGEYYVGEIANNNMTGQGTYYFPDNSYTEGQRKNGELNGYATTYNAYYNILFSGNYIDGKKEGTFKLYDITNNTTTFYEYKNGELYDERAEKLAELDLAYQELDEWYREEMDELYEYIKYGDPFSTDWAKSIYGQFGINTGSSPAYDNLDSYAAANAMRQNAALKSKADAAILEYNQTYIKNRKQLIEDTYKQRKQYLDSIKNTLDLKYQ